MNKTTMLSLSLLTCLVIPIALGTRVIGPERDSHASRAGLLQARGKLRVASSPQQRLPATLAFTLNQGQWPEAVHYRARRGPLAIWLQRNGWTFTLENANRGVAVRMLFQNAQDTTPRGQQKIDGCSHYFLGSDPQRWATSVPRFARTIYDNMYPGIDVVTREAGGTLEYDLVLAPGADLRQVVVACDGIDRLSLDQDGALVMHTAIVDIKQSPPTTWVQAADGKRNPIPCRYVLIDDRHYGFTAPAWKGTDRLIIDPGITWLSYLGTNKGEYNSVVAFDSKRNLVLAGESESDKFPTTTGAYDRTHNGSEDVVISKLSADGKKLLWSTYIGGSAEDLANDMRLAADDSVFVGGSTESANFPTTNGAWDRSHNGAFDGYGLKLDANGGKLLWSTFLGGSKDDELDGIEIGSKGEVWLAGSTASTNLPTTKGVVQGSSAGAFDAFAARMDLTKTGSAQRVWCTYLGGRTDDGAFHMTVEPKTQDVFLAGGTDSPNFPTTQGAHDRVLGGVADGILVRLKANGSSLVWSTYFGGTGTSAPFEEWGETVRLAPNGDLVICGPMASADFPTTQGAWDRSYGGKGDGFCARFSPAGKPVWSTMIGGQNLDYAEGLAVDVAGTVTVTGWTDSTDYQTTAGAHATTRTSTSGTDGFLLRLTPDGQKALYSSYLVGEAHDQLFSCAVDWDGNLAASGETASSKIGATAGAFDATFNGNRDAFALHMDMLPEGVNRLGTTAPTCNGPVVFYPTERPTGGSTTFGLFVGGAPPSTRGAILVGIAPSTKPFFLDGAQLYVSVAQPHILLFFQSDGNGRVQLPIPLPNSKGARAFLQTLWINPTRCAENRFGLGSSAVLDITIQ